MASTKVQRVMTQPINLIFRFLQSKARIQIWLFEQKDLRIEGRIIGFDEYMNLVLDDAEEVNVKKKSRKTLGRILLKGDNITLMMNTSIELDASKIPIVCKLMKVSLDIQPYVIEGESAGTYDSLVQQLGSVVEHSHNLNVHRGCHSHHRKKSKCSSRSGWFHKFKTTQHDIHLLVSNFTGRSSRK
ncbi:hypothetical protein RJT34_28051 [Clitoria ternatea]|uniref:Small nuclear ribonucleoprotein E n=1 Tax=Clitoria ternatea TaxID=43366 RepID=A0AAN9FAH2_CLITE